MFPQMDSSDSVQTNIRQTSISMLRRTEIQDTVYNIDFQTKATFRVIQYAT